MKQLCVLESRHFIAPCFIVYGQLYRNLYTADIVEAHCYFVDIGRIDREQIRSRINNNDCRTFRPRRPLSTAYRTVLYAVDKGLRGRNVLQSLLLILLRICSRSNHPIVYCSRIKSLDGTCTRDPNMNLIIQYGLLGLVLGLGLGFILY